MLKFIRAIGPTGSKMGLASWSGYGRGAGIKGTGPRV